jgi:hypothetical protein
MTVKILPKQIWKEEFDYVSDKSVDSLKSDIQQLFDQTKGWNFPVNLTGEFISDNEFKMTPKWQLVVIRNFEREISYLNGKIFQDEFKRTRVIFTVRPNSIFPIFFFLFPLFGLFALTNNNAGQQRSRILVVGVIFTFVVPIVMLVFGYFAKKGIKDRFITTFNLKPANY